MLLRNAVRSQNLQLVEDALRMAGHKHRRVMHNPDEDGSTPLHVAAAEGSVEIIRALLRPPFPADATSRMFPDPWDSESFYYNGGMTPLHVAAFNGNTDAVFFFLTLPDVDIEDTGMLYGQSSGTALLHALAGGYPDTALALLDAGASPLATDAAGCTALHYCALHSDDEEYMKVMKKAINLGADVNAESEEPYYVVDGNLANALKSIHLARPFISP